MRRLVFVLVVLGLAIGISYAGDDKCKSVEDLAEVIMGCRQSGVAMSSAMKVADDEPVTRAMVIDAWQRPMYNTEEYKQRSIQRFKDDWYMQCVTGKIIITD